MNILNNMLPVEQRRMKIALIALTANYILFAIGIFKGVGFADLGAGLALVNSPIITFIVGESIRPTGGSTNTVTTTSSISSRTGATTDITTDETH